MLKRFSVQGYRTFEHEIVLDLSKTRDYQFNTQNVREGIVNNALIVGPNASGKSNLGRAIADICDIYRRRADGDDALEDVLYLNADCGSGLARFEYVFKFGEDEVTYAYDKSPDGAFHHERLLLGNRIVFDYENDESRFLEGDLSLVGADGINRRFEDDFLSMLSYISNSVPRESLGVLDELRSFVSNMSFADPHPDRRPYAEAYVRRIVRLGKVEEFEEFLRRFGVDERLCEVTEPDGRKSIYSEHSQRLIPFSAACSSGTRTLLYLYAWYVLRPQKTLVFLDEFDAYCHFEMAEKLIDFFGESTSCQTICTTHNTSLVQNDVMRPDCVFLLSAKKTLAALSDRTSRELRYGHNIEKLLRNGEFG